MQQDGKEKSFLSRKKSVKCISVTNLLNLRHRALTR